MHFDKIGIGDKRIPRLTDTSELKEELHWESAEDFWNEIER
jgi:hypothetical protein